jgi:hypothetical protein
MDTRRNYHKSLYTQVMNKVEKRFRSKAIIKGGIMLLSKPDALLFLNECKVSGIQIIGIDAFYLIGENIQPSLDNSADFSFSEFQRTPDDAFSEVMNFLTEKSDELYFEIVCAD